MEDASDLGNLGQQIKEHWQKYRPRMFCELNQAATLAEAVQHRRSPSARGLASDQARELVREEWP